MSLIDPTTERALAAMQAAFADSRRPRDDDEARRRVDALVDAINKRVIDAEPVDWLVVQCHALCIAGIAGAQEQRTA